MHGVLWANLALCKARKAHALKGASYAIDAFVRLWGALFHDIDVNLRHLSGSVQYDAIRVVARGVIEQRCQPVVFAF